MTNTKRLRARFRRTAGNKPPSEICNSYFFLWGRRHPCLLASISRPWERFLGDLAEAYQIEGKCTVNVVPVWSESVNSRLPSWACAIQLAMERPNPAPAPSPSSGCERAAPAR